MQRRTFFKAALLSAAALVTPKITALEAQAANDVPTPKPLMGRRAYVTTVKGPTAVVTHSLGRACVFVVACTLDGKHRAPRVEPPKGVQGRRFL